MRAPQSRSEPEMNSWMAMLPHDFLSHRNTWRQGFERLIELEPESGRPDADKKGFWKHELRAFDFAYQELDALAQVQQQDDAPWADRLPHDFLSHRLSWRQAFERLIELEPASGRPDSDEKGFWKHELHAFDFAYQQLDSLLAELQISCTPPDQAPAQ